MEEFKSAEDVFANYTDKPGARHSRIKDPKVREAIMKGVKAGLAYVHCAFYAGISDGTLRTWMRKGSEALEVLEEAGSEAVDPDDYSYMLLTANIRKAEAELLEKRFGMIEKHARKDWRANAWLNERRYPHTYGLKVSEQSVDQRTAQVSAEDIAAARQKALDWESGTFGDVGESDEA